MRKWDGVRRGGGEGEIEGDIEKEMEERWREGKISLESKRLMLKNSAGTDA
jgi:hypothetical protein